MIRTRKTFRHLFTCLLLLFFSMGPLAGQHFFDPMVVHKLVLEIDLEGWADSLMQYKKTYSNRRIGGNLIVDGRQFDPVGIRYKGHSSFFNFAKEEKSKLPFNINMKSFVKEQEFERGITKLKLSNNYRDISYIREMLSRHIAGQYVPLPDIAFAEVHANDKYLGLYNLVEGLESPFLQRSFGGKKGVLIKCDPIWKSPEIKGCPVSDNASLEYLGEDIACYKKWYDLKSKRGWTSLIRLTRILEQQPDSIEAVLDVYSALWMLALNNTIVNLDSYSGALGHNYYLFQPKGGVFVPLMWDMNLSFGGFQFTAQNSKLSKSEMIVMDPLLHADPPSQKRPLIARLLAQPVYRKLYISMIRTVLDDFFTNGMYLELAKKYHALISPSVEAEEGRIYPYDYFRNSLHGTTNDKEGALIGISELMEPRTKFLAAHPALQNEAPGYHSHFVTRQDSLLQVTLLAEDVARAWIHLRRGKKYKFRKYEMQMVEQGKWQVTLDQVFHESRCFFVLENEGAAIMWPERAPKENFRLE